eukprot:CAMPEP_0179165454 /NCGR_PEP_ID=MMETSP0796-20121207/81263_1 /TAXON_ID=73915 /ORGANISM="Pyrodinium bahamense, Strain pbaha01" /LENGTH=284 /DNA_ID=CAMNT_0020868015 /DNA_START=116 /DNA_END=971 /DNA_ORIENTATION=+
MMEHASTYSRKAFAWTRPAFLNDAGIQVCYHKQLLSCYLLSSKRPGGLLAKWREQSDHRGCKSRPRPTCDTSGHHTSVSREARLTDVVTSWVQHCLCPVFASPDETGAICNLAAKVASDAHPRRDTGDDFFCVGDIGPPVGIRALQQTEDAAPVVDALQLPPARTLRPAVRPSAWGRRLCLRVCHHGGHGGRGGADAEAGGLRQGGAKAAQQLDLHRLHLHIELGPPVGGGRALRVWRVHQAALIRVEVHEESCTARRTLSMPANCDAHGKGTVPTCGAVTDAA